MKRVKFLRWQGMSNEKINKIRNKNKRIAIIAASSKLGVTHMCLCLANFLASGLKEKVLYIELCETSQLLGTVGNKLLSYEGSSAFIHKGVTYVLACSVEEAKRLISSHQGYVIVDINHLDDKTKVIFDQCDKQVVIGSMKSWCIKDLYILIDYLEGGRDMKNMTFYNKSQSRNENTDFKKIFKYKMKSLPIIEDPFSIKEKDFNELIEMIM